MIKDIVKDAEALGVPAEAATAEDAQVAEDLRDTMLANEGCACLAANQVGSTKAVIAYEEDGRVHVMFNPKIVASMQPFKTVESCLSFDEPSEVKRFNLIRVSYEVLADGKLVPRTKKFSGWTAEIIQHAVDHCAGKLV